MLWRCALTEWDRALRETWKAVLASLSLLLWWLWAIGSFEPAREALLSVAADARAVGLEVGLRSTYDTPPERTLLVPLDAVHAPSGELPWAPDFARGVFGGSRAEIEGIDAAFDARWDRAAGTGRRVAIAFARADVHHAEAARRLLGEDYVVFTYLRADDAEPLVSPQIAGRYFGEADVRLAVLSDASFSGGAVGFEAELVRQVRAGTT